MKGRKWLILLVMALACVLLAGSALADSLRCGAVDNGNSVNLRQSASTGSAWLGSYPRGTWMRILGEQGNFYYVRTPDGKTGYMHKDYVSVTSVAKGTIGVIDTTSYVNLRK